LGTQRETGAKKSHLRPREIAGLKKRTNGERRLTKRLQKGLKQKRHYKPKIVVGRKGGVLHGEFLKGKKKEKKGGDLPEKGWNTL